MTYQCATVLVFDPQTLFYKLKHVTQWINGRKKLEERDDMFMSREEILNSIKSIKLPYRLILQKTNLKIKLKYVIEARSYPETKIVECIGKGIKILL